MINDQAAGIYRAAYNLILPLTMVTAAISGAVFPYVSQNYKTQPDEVARTVKHSLSSLLMIALPIAVITTCLSQQIVSFLFKPEYSDAAVSLLILVWFLPIAYVTNLFGHILGAMDNQMYVLKVAAVNVVVNIVANIILIPHFAQNGAAVVTVFTELVGFFILFAKIQSQFASFFDYPRLLKILTACAVPLAFFLLRLQWHVLILLGIGVLLYIAGLWMMKVFTLSQLRSIISLVKNRT